MNLSDFVKDELGCKELQGEVMKFLLVIKPNLISDYACPVCREDLRETYNPHQSEPGRGNCAMCKLGIQMTHRIRHENHDGCEVLMTYPVSLCDPSLTKLLREAWVKMHGETLLSAKLLLRVEQSWDQTDWVNEALRIQQRYDARRRPKT